jgi:hypothetical protein
MRGFGVVSGGETARHEPVETAVIHPGNKLFLIDQANN